MKKEEIVIESSPAKKSHKNWIFILLIIILLIAILIALAYISYNYFIQPIEPNATIPNQTYVNDTTPVNDSRINDTSKPIVPCGDGKCNGTENYNNCPKDCKKPTGPGPAPCTPNCAGKQCGGDGCGGSCGACSSGICNSTGNCVELINCTIDSNCSYLTAVCGTGLCNQTIKQCYVSFNLSTVLCRNNISECDVQEMCSGTSVNCQDDLNKSDGSICLGGTCNNGKCIVCANCSEENIHVSALLSMARINQTVPIGNEKNITIYAAGNEYESFQIAIRAETVALSNVNVVASDLVSNSGNTISKSNITLYRESYIYVHSSPNNVDAINKPLGTGWYPDGLIPFVNPATGNDLTGATLDAVPFSLAMGYNQLIWIDIYVPNGTVPGNYTGTFKITSDQGNSTVNVTVHVWGFNLPKQPSLKTLFGISMSSQTTAEAANLFEAMKELSRHKIYPERLTGPDNYIYPNLTNQQMLVDRYGMSQTTLPYWANANPSAGYMDPPPSLSVIQTQLTRYAPGIEPICYPLDEPGSNAPNIYSGIIAWSSRFHEAGIRQLITMPPTTGLFDDGRGTGQSAVDIWVIVPFQYDNYKSLVDQAMKKGDEVWSYNGLVQDLYSPKWEIDFAPINYRIQPGFISQSLNITGLLYWRTDFWSSDPWNNADNAGHWSANNYPGEGMLVYPGQQVGLPGVVPSMRLNYLRDGVEDYDYIQLLKNLGRGDWAINQAAIVGKNWSSWTRDSGVLESQRIKLGEEIEKINLSSSGLPSKNENILIRICEWLSSLFS